MYLLIIILPLISSICCGLFGFLLGTKFSQRVSIILIFITALIALLIFFDVGIYNNPCYIKLSKWIHTSYISLNWGFMFDSLTATMLVVVCTISAAVHFYSVHYMENDPHIPRFMSYLSLFTFFMVILVTSDNFIQLFIGWEGVGLCSYLLINFWFTRIQANKSAVKAILVNRVGDIALILGITFIYFIFRTLNFSTLFVLIPFAKNIQIDLIITQVNAITLISILLLIGAVGKSAQIGLHTWLPDAMEGPTPVSALIHAATMVTAGVFLIIRCSPIFEYSPTALFIISIVGSLTALFAALTGVWQYDIKRVIAFSTCSQLGYMFMACGSSAYNAALYHLTTHAFFKALLFLGAGSIIHALSDEQDMRKMGGMVRILPLTYTTMLVGTLCIVGFPFLSGFFSKDLILETIYSTYTINSTIFFLIGTLGAFLTSFYSSRLLYLAFLSKPNGYKSVIINAHENKLHIYSVLIFLSICAVLCGYLLSDVFNGPGSTFFSNSIFQLPKNFINTENNVLDPLPKVLPLIFSLLGFVGGLIVYKNYLLNFAKLRIKNNKLFFFFSKKWAFDKLINNFCYKFLVISRSIFLKEIDKGWIEYILPISSNNFIVFAYNLTQYTHKGLLNNYLFSIFSGVFITLCLTIIV